MSRRQETATETSKQREREKFKPEVDLSKQTADSQITDRTFFDSDLFKRASFRNAPFSTVKRAIER
jgi:hypothetical protein